MLTVALVNSKAGTGKTTSAVWLAHAFMELGYAVCLVDADPAGSALSWSAHTEGFPFRMFSLPTRELHARLPDIARPDEIVLVDAPPAGDHAAIANSAMRAADEILIPCSPTPVEVDRTGPMLGAIADINTIRAKPVRSAVMLNRTVAHARSTDDARTVLEGVGFDVLSTSVPRLERWAQSWGEPVYASGTIWSAVAAELLNRGGIR